MKVLDVNSLLTGIDHTTKSISTLHEQISAIQRAVRDFSTLDDDLKGEGGNAIRSFYQECHQPLLIFLYQSLINYNNVLTNMAQAVNSFESNNNGFIREQFLENNVLDGLDKVEKTTISMTDSANDVIESVQGLVRGIKKLDESDFIDDVRIGKEKEKDTIEELHSLDRSQVAALESVKADIHILKKYMDDIASAFKSGDLSVKNFNPEVLNEISSHGFIMDSIYGKGYTALAKLESLIEKMVNGEVLSPAEQDVLYDYLQNVYLDSDKKKEIQEISDSMSEEGIDNLKARLNEKVVVSKTALDDEIAMIAAYLYLGPHTPKETEIDDEVRAKLETYLVLLNDYRSTMGKNTVIIVGRLEYDKYHKDIYGHYIFSALQTAEYRDEIQEVITEQRFREHAFDPENYRQVDDWRISEITYYPGLDASANLIDKETDEIEDKKANYTTTFITNKVIDRVVSEISKAVKIGEAVGGFKMINEYQSGIEEHNRDITINDAMTASIRLKLELSISKNRDVPGTDSINVQLYPRDETFEILERWKKLHENYPEVTFPKEYIFKEDWYEVNEELTDLKNTYGVDLTDYIIGGELDDDENIEDLLKEND